ncbi:MAG: hypothetical protein L3J46_07905, partial [Kangiellaceae bacterium]|nr:hypothetical protein [Kangiellaceae bacterium]
MKSLFPMVLIFITIGSCLQSVRADELNTQLLQINNFHFVSPQLASSGLLELDMYAHIEEYGFK